MVCKTSKWDTVVEEETNWGQFLAEKQMSLSLLEPMSELERQDDRQLRAKILALTSPQAKQLGIGKSTLHYLRRRTNDQLALRVYSKTRNRLSASIH